LVYQMTDRLRFTPILYLRRVEKLGSHVLSRQKNKLKDSIDTLAWHMVFCPAHVALTQGFI